jgi:hypothetical protein
MAQIVKELRVDVSQPNVFQAIVAKQHDSNSRFLKITLVDFGVKVEVPNTAKVTINANRPDGASESFKGEANNDGTITVPLAQWMLDIDGEVKCDVSVTNTEDNKRLTSTDFWLEVQKAANPNASIPLDPDGEILIIKPVTEINGNSKDTDYPSAKAVYDYGQNVVTDTQITATATGNAITIESAEAPLQNLKLFGKTTQDGTPTPDNPIELKSVGDSGSYEVGVYGKNLVKIKEEAFSTVAGKTFVKNGVTFTLNEDKSITVNGTATATAQLNFCDLDIPKGKYIISGYPSNTFISGVEYYLRAATDTGWYVRIGEVEVEYTQDTTGYIVISISANSTANNLTFYPMFRRAEITDNTYEPYKAKQFITFTDTLRGKGDIADEKDFARGVTTQRFGVVDLGTLDWSLHTDSTTGKTFFYYNAPFPSKYGSGLNTLMCTHYKVVSDRFALEEGCISPYNVTNNNRLCVLDTRYTDATTFTSAVSGVKLVYQLETPIETPISESELNAYRQLHTNKPNTTILSGCEDTEITYYVNKPNAQAIGSLHEQINKDYLKLQQAIISTGGSTL